MSYQRLYNFQAGTKINSGQVNGELDQLINAANELETSDGDIKSKAQMVKITSDTGDFKVKISDTTTDLLDTILNTGEGLMTVYCVGGGFNNPSNTSVRGTAFVSGTPTFGWVLLFDSTGGMYINYLSSGVWQGWNLKTILWSGIAYPQASNTIAPSKNLSQCRNGWILVWSDYDFGVGSNDFDIAFSFVPKGDPFAHGNSHIFDVPNNLTSSASSAIRKKLLISDSSIVGHDDNNVTSTSTNDVVLRYVLEF
jgi:hypothetical protein